MEVKVRFYGILADVAGTSIRTYQGVISVGDLKLRIQDDFPEIVHYNYNICINSVFINGESVLRDGDEVALLPPFLGG